MWGNQAKWVWTLTYHIFSFLLSVIFHSKSYVLQKTPLKLDMSFWSYDVLKDCQNSRKQKDLFSLFGSIFKSIFASSDSFCLNTSHMLNVWCVFRYCFTHPIFTNNYCLQNYPSFPPLKIYILSNGPSPYFAEATMLFCLTYTLKMFAHPHKVFDYCTIQCECFFMFMCAAVA